MKKNLTLFVFSAAFCIILGSVLISGCTKEGPEGPPGMDGADATETCMTCHNFSEDLVAKIGQYYNSAHASGNNISRNNPNCSHCHTSQGFRTFLETGESVAVPEPTAINCRTCHPIHETYTFDDYRVRTDHPVSMILAEGTYDYGNSNLCANCHQGRPVSPFPVPGESGELTITNARFGPHYGPQANIFIGKGGYEIAGSMPYQNSVHTNIISDGCITCHMAPPVGYDAGGHQMSIKYGTSSYNYSGCSGCHTDAAELTARMNNNREEIYGLTIELRDLLIDHGLLNEGNLLVPTPIDVTHDQAGAILNYKFVYGDKSHGAHNYKYVKALLINSIESLQ